MRIIVADDHHLVLAGLTNAIQLNYPDCKIDQAIDKNELDGLLKKGEIDLLILDVKFGEDNAKLFIPDLKENYPELKILILSSVSDQMSISYLTNLGISGYLLKSDSLVEVLSAIRQILNGETYFSAQISAKSDQVVEVVLSPREKEVLTHIISEKSTKQISDVLGISEKTVEMHRANMFVKLEVKNLAGLVKKTILLGLLEDEN